MACPLTPRRRCGPSLPQSPEASRSRAFFFNRRPGERNNRGRVATGGAPAAEWNPASVASAPLVVDADMRKGTTMSTALIDVVGGGPAITMTGTLLQATTTIAPRIEIIDATTCRISRDNGSSYETNGTPGDPTKIPIPAGSTYPLVGTDIVFAFASGTYATNHLYLAQGESVTDASGNGWTFTRNGSSNAPLLNVGPGPSNNGYSRLTKGVMGRPAFVTNAAAGMENTAGLATALVGGVSNSFDIWMLGSFDAIGAGVQIVIAAGDTGSAVKIFEIYENGATKYSAAIKTDAAVTTTVGPGSVGSDTKFHIWRLTYDGVNVTLYCDNVQIDQKAYTGTLTVNVFSLFQLRRNTISGQAKFSLCRMLGYSNALSAGDATTVFTQLALIHDWYAPKTVLVHWEGDSYFGAARGEGSTPNRQRCGNDIVTRFNTASTGAQLADIVARASTVDANLAAAAQLKILVLHIGMNDLGALGTGNLQATLDGIKDYITARRTATSGLKVVLRTWRPRSGDGAGGPENATYQTKRIAGNIQILANYCGADIVVDDCTGAPGALGDNVYYDAVAGGHPGLMEASRAEVLDETAYRTLRLAA